MRFFITNRKARKAPMTENYHAGKILHSPQLPSTEALFPTHVSVGARGEISVNSKCSFRHLNWMIFWGDNALKEKP